MNVLYSTYPWAFDCPGGGERQLSAWSNHLKNLGVDVKYFNQWNPNFHSFELFHFFSVMPGSYNLCNYAKSKGLKLVITPNLWVTEDTKYNYPHQEILDLLNIADAIIVNSKMEAQQFSLVYQIPIDRFHVVYNGFESEFLTRINSSLFFESFPQLAGKKFLLNVANIEPRKNQLRLIKATSNFHDLYVVNIGLARDGDYANECRRLGADKFIELGEFAYNNDILRSAFSAAIGFAMPSLIETPSIAALEAAAYGLPLIITNVGSTTEYFGSSANYVNPNCYNSIVKGIDKFCRNKIDDQSVSLLAREFTIDKAVKNLHTTYLKVLK